MLLTDLDPKWVMIRPRNRIIGVSFLCPQCLSKRLTAHFSNPLDPGPPAKTEELWQRTGDNFESLTLIPLIDRAPSHKHWQGPILKGEVLNIWKRPEV